MTKSKLIILISSIVAAIAIALTVTLIIVLRPKAEPSNNGSIGEARSIKIVALEGSATLTDGNEKIDCFKGMNLYDGDHIDVLDNSVLVARFDEDKYVYFAENTSINIKSSGKDKYKTNIFVEKGKVLAELINKLGEDEEFFLSSNNSVMAVRGTTFGVEVKDKGNEFEISYSVYKGVTELFVFDKNENDFISGKLSDISNQKLTLTIPKDHILDANKIKDMVGEWLENVKSIFDDETDANEKLDEVQIVVSTPTKEDYEKFIGIIEEVEKEEREQKKEQEQKKDDSVVESNGIKYVSQGFFGNYDGESHSISVIPTDSKAIVSYKGENATEYSATNPSYYAPGTYKVNYKITCEGYEDVEGNEIVVIAKPNVIITSNHISYDNVSKSSILSIEGIEATKFNRYNGVLASELLANAKFLIGSKEVEAKNITINYNHINENYLELQDGKNTMSVTLEFDDYQFKTDVNFYFSDSRDDIGYVVGAIGSNITLLNDNIYYVNISAFEEVNNKYQISGNDLLTEFGLDVQDLTTMYINSSFDVEDKNNTELIACNGTNNFSFDLDTYNIVNFLVYPTSTYKGFNETVYMYVSTEEPTEYPSYTVGSLNYVYNPNKTPNGVKMDFIQSEDTVTYSLDGASYEENLYINKEGSYEVYFNITNTQNSSIVINGSKFVTVKQSEGQIMFDSSKFIMSPVHILSNDNNTLTYEYYNGDNNATGNLNIINGNTVTSLDNAYLVYSDMIKNAKFYDSVTKEEIEAIVTISEKKANSANFNYTIEAEGYDTINGVVQFDYSEIGYVGEVSSNDLPLSVTLPVDYQASLTELQTVIPSRVVFSLENTDLINYETYYSIDEGKTWSTTSPKITETGNYKVYTLYCFVDKGNDATDLVDGELNSSATTNLAATGNFIITVQNITVEE